MIITADPQCFYIYSYKPIKRKEAKQPCNCFVTCEILVLDIPRYPKSARASDRSFITDKSKKIERGLNNI